MEEPPEPEGSLTAFEIAERNHAAGWPGQIPLPTGRKAPVPTGVTGYEGQDWPLDKVRRKMKRHGFDNLAVRMPRGEQFDVIAIDIDDYEHGGKVKTGGQTIKKLERTLGTLPLQRTWKITSRGDDAISGKYLFRVPAGTKLVTRLPDVEIIQWFHRYVMTYPSTNGDDGGRPVRLWSPGSDRRLVEVLPPPSKLPKLPEAWVQHLADGAGFRESLRVNGEQVQQFYDGLPAGEPCRAVNDALETALEACHGASRHDGVLPRVLDLLRRGEQGHSGVPEAMERLRYEFITAVSNRSDDRVAEDEFGRMVLGHQGVGQILAKPTPEEKRGCKCDRPPESLPGEDDEPSWMPKDLTAILDGTHKPLEPTVLARTDGRCMFYPGKIHWVSGESESGKSWLCIQAAVEVIRAGGRVMYVDYEDDGPETVRRFQSLGLSRDQILNQLDYINPDARPDSNDERAQWQFLLTREGGYGLVVIDAVTEALSIEGKSSNDNDEIASWVRRVPRTLAEHTGAAVVCIDHVTKNADTRGRFSIGGQYKMAGINGAAFIVEPVDPIAPGRVGRMRIKVAKDRGGQVRKHARGWDKRDRLQMFADAVMDATGDLIDITLFPPKEDEPDQFDESYQMQEKVAEFLQEHPGSSGREVERGVTGNASAKREALKIGEARGTFVSRKSGTATLWSLAEKPPPEPSPG
ncbi:hypothetical protein A4R43_36610 [Amycolatopsis albispora]|uniref:DNA primase/polymerase bifunctional N-terminal domain-containing protein n=2 Tax=Amycolatopsis albispora TaxID=1804986 RepID=A0A344LGW9_9PSEU|nr:hypothetical protein A4R43_36610 [Amycolatopsis albispora]